MTDDNEVTANQLKEAHQALIDAQLSLEEAQRSTRESRNIETNALNRLNEAQRTFDQLVGAVRKRSRVLDSDWYRAHAERGRNGNPAEA